AKVIHPRTVLPAVEAGIPVRILNTFAPSDRGTTITSNTDKDGSVVKATTSLGGLGMITVQGAGMSGVPGFAARVFDTAAAERVSVMMISQSSSENSICLVVPDDATDRLKSALERMFNAELQRHDVEKIAVERPVAIVADGGECRDRPGPNRRSRGAGARSDHRDRSRCVRRDLALDAPGRRRHHLSGAARALGPGRQARGRRDVLELLPHLHGQPADDQDS